METHAQVRSGAGDAGGASEEDNFTDRLPESLASGSETLTSTLAFGPSSHHRRIMGERKENKQTR
jgi:hypothetical protein